MSQEQDYKFQRVRTRTSSPLAHMFSKRTTWFSIAMCLVLLFAAAVMLIQQNPAGAQAAQGKHAISKPKHVPSKSHPSRIHVAPKTGPMMSVSPPALNFNLSLAQSATLTQTFTLKNSGIRPLYWHISANPAVAAWISSAIPAKGTIVLQQIVSVKVTVKPTKLVPGTYTTQLVLVGTDQQGLVAGGSPQAITILLTVTP